MHGISHCRPGISREAMDVNAMMASCMKGERPPTGLWKWGSVAMEIAFFHDNKAGGAGSDDIGEFFVSGTWGRHGVKIVLHYIGNYDITFDGGYADGKVTGSCLKSNGGEKTDFELVYCGKGDTVEPTSGLWTGYMFRSGCKHQLQIDIAFGSPPYKTISGRGKDDNGSFRIKGRLDGRALRILRQNVIYYGFMNEAGTEVVGTFFDSGMCWVEGKFVLKLGGGAAASPGPSESSESPISGVWFWFLSGQTDYRCYLQLMFRTGSVTGSGRDDTGYFTLTGSWSGTSITFTKSTTSVTYTGNLCPAGNVITGTGPDAVSFNIAFFMEFELPDIPYQFPNKNIYSGQQCAIKLYQEIQVWLTRRQRVIQEFKILIDKIQQGGSGDPQYEGGITDVEQLVTICFSLLTLLSGGGAAGALLNRFGSSSTEISFSSVQYTSVYKMLEIYRSSSEAETLKDLIEEDVIFSRIIYFLIDSLWNISTSLSTQSTVEISINRIVKGLLFQAATNIDIISFAFQGEAAAPICSAPEYDHGKLVEIEQSLLECIEIITTVHKEAEEMVAGTVGIAIAMPRIQASLQDITDNSITVIQKSVETCLVILEEKMDPYKNLQQKTDVYIETRASLAVKFETTINVEFVTEMLGILNDFNPDWCQMVSDAGLQDVLAVTMTKVTPAIRQKVNLMMSRLDPNSQDAPVDILDIVVIGEAAVGLPSVTRKSMFPVPTLQDVVLYEPYGCTIDQSTVLGIASGLIKPSSRQLADDAQVPASWNSLLAGQSEDLPSIYLQQTCISEVAYAELKDILVRFPDSVQRNRLIIPFFTASESDNLPPVPLWLFSSACALAGMVNGINVRVHLATSLPVPEPTEELQSLCQSQYSFSQTSMRCNVAELHLEGVDTTWLDTFIHSETLTSYFSSSSTHTRNMTFEGGVIRVTTTTTTTYG